MNLLECLVALAISMALLNPLLKTSADLLAKQVQHEKTQALISEAERAFELIGRAIRMAGYRNINSSQQPTKNASKNTYLDVQKKTGYRGSDAIVIRHELSNGIDLDCIGNVLSKDRTKNQLAYQGFLVDRQAGIPKGVKVNGGSLVCQSLDREGRKQNTTLMNGVNSLLIEELNSSMQSAELGQKLYKVELQMTDGVALNIRLERTFSTRNLP
ncbi:hypothetical protein [Polynucleobacter alcilacus]|uniref:hypothetical protein n=1 Tax=Polynucleobacter alcilacus TaxID=1819739 RepID=UPI001C0DC465|nr:hypothetical protein [Polynucleobacter alcilacus]MBU3568117.1 hypothetical protein [Polynucleobacter alcilacus]